jgi:hypothetical protein
MTVHTARRLSHASRLSAGAVVLAILSAPIAVGADDDKPCREHPRLFGPCFRVRGRMNYYNGTPSVRIWIVGTNRIVGVSESRFVENGYSNLPDDLSAKLSFDTDLFADFTVCPFTAPRAGEMRMVCVDSAENVRVQRGKQ